MITEEWRIKKIKVWLNTVSEKVLVAVMQCHNDSGPLFRKSTIPTNPKADPNPYPNLNLNPNVSTVACIHTMDFRNIADLRNSGPVLPQFYKNSHP